MHKLFRGRLQSRGQAIYGSVAFGAGGAVGNLASGYLWTAAGPALTFTFSAAAALVGLALVAWRLEGEH